MSIGRAEGELSGGGVESFGSVGTKHSINTSSEGVSSRSSSEINSSEFNITILSQTAENQITGLQFKCEI